MTPADENDSAANEADARELAPGLDMQRAREARELSIEEVAEELHLDPAVVVAIEKGEFEGLGAPVFVKGYLRGYARLLGMDEEAAVAAYMPAAEDPEEFRTLSMRREVKSGASLSMFVLWAALGALALFALLYLVLGGSEEESSSEADFVVEPAADETAASEPAVDSAPTVVAKVSAPLREDFVTEAGPEPERTARLGDAPTDAERVLESTDSEDELSVRTQLEPAPEVEPEAVAEIVEPEPAEPAVVSSTVRMELNFVGECWVELSDGRRRLLYGLEKPGRRRSFDAEPPLRLFFGDASAVEIRFDDREYQIPRAFRTARNTARFTLTRADIEALR